MVNTPTVEIRGRTVPDAVVSVNGTAVEVASSGDFSSVVPLAEGPNSIEVIVSDFQGSQEYQVLSVIYLK